MGFIFQFEFALGEAGVEGEGEEFEPRILTNQKQNQYQNQ